MRTLGVVLVGVCCACGSVSKKTNKDAAVDGRSIDSPSASPMLASIAPTSGKVTTIVTLTGTLFGSAQGSVTFGGTAATIQSWSDTSITATVPDVLPGNVDVVVTSGGGT